MTRIYFATNRNNNGSEETPDFGSRFHSDGPRFYRVGHAEVEKHSDDPDEGYRVSGTYLYPEAVDGDVESRGSSLLFSQLRAELAQNKRDILIFVHGFANDFESGMARAGQLADVYKVARADGTRSSPVLFTFSWPSNGRVSPPWHYFSDRNDAEDSGKAMARSLLRLLDFLANIENVDDTCKQRLHLIVHSMGAWALRHAVQALRQELGDDGLRPVFENVYIMAGDEDDDALEPDKTNKLGLLPRLGRRIHIYHSADDAALVISDKTKFNPDRLGYQGPRSFSGLSTRIQAIDCELVDKSKISHVNHQYYRLRKEVIKDVSAVMSGQLRPETLPWREAVEPGRRYRMRLDDPETVPNTRDPSHAHVEM